MAVNIPLLVALFLYVGSQGGFVVFHHREMVRRGYRLSRYWTRYIKD